MSLIYVKSIIKRSVSSIYFKKKEFRRDRFNFVGKRKPRQDCLLLIRTDQILSSSIKHRISIHVDKGIDLFTYKVK